MGGLCKEGHDFLRVCKKKDPAATQRMIDVLVTQHSKWTARRLRRALFGQSIVDFTADPWAGVHSERDSKAAGAQKKTKKKQSRLEREFSQGESKSSRASSSQSSEETVRQSSQVILAESNCAGEEMPDGTMYFSQGSFFKILVASISGFQKQNFQTHFQDAHFHNVSHTEEQIFPTSFLAPSASQKAIL